MVAAVGLPTAPTSGAVIDVFFIFGGDHCRTSASTPRGPSLTSSTSVVVTARNTDNTPKGAAIDVFYISGGRSWEY
jgi:hypothetical protein